MPTILRETYPTAKKEHRCEFCCEKIAIGQNMSVRQMSMMELSMTLSHIKNVMR